MSDNMYCGIGKIPAGKIKGTQEYCIKNKQVRMYGLEKIDKALLEELKVPKINLIKEQLKLRKINDEARLLINEAKKLKIIIDNENSKKSDVNRASKRLKELIVKKDNLIIRLEKQKKIVATTEKNKALEIAAAKKNAKKPAKKKPTKKNSGSKNTKKYSGSKTRSKK